MILLAIGVLATALLLVATHAVLTRRTLRDEQRMLRDQVHTLGERLGEVERSAGDAAHQAEAAGTVLLEKGLINEEDLEAARRRFAADDDPQTMPPSRTVH